MQKKIVRLFDRRSRINFVSVVITLRASTDSTLRSLVFNLMVFSIAICEGLLLNFLFQGQISLIILGTRKIRLSKKISNDQELIQSDPISCPQNQKGNN